MTERRRRKKQEEEVEDSEEGELNEEQTEIAKHLRFNCPTKSSTFHNDKIQYFKGSKAIECILDSKWASGKKGAEILFTHRESVQDYLQVLLELGLFKRIIRVRKKKKGQKDEVKKSKDGKDSPKANKDEKESTEASNEADGKKKKVKIKIEMHERQVFLDGDEVYMWIYDPVHPRTIFYGVLVVIGAIILCLFPLWPMQMREYVWYLSVAAATLLGSLILVACLSYVLFALIWLVTGGRHHFWLLPNLLEDQGVLESFVPLYAHTYYGKENTDTKVEEDEQDEDKDNGDGEGKDQNEDNEDNKDNDNKDKDEDDEDDEDDRQNQDDTKDEPSASKKDGNGDGEPWVQVTPEDIAQAKEATVTS